MFDPQITHARELIARLERCQHEGFQNVPASVPVHEEEYKAWYGGIEEIISSAFGPSSQELTSWRDLRVRLGPMIDRSIHESPGGSAIPGYVSYYNACIACLRELDTKLALSGSPARAAAGASASLDSPPDSFQKAAVRLLWPSRPWLRIALVLTVGLGIGTFAIWSSLPDGAKESVIRWVVPPPGSGPSANYPNAQVWAGEWRQTFMGAHSRTFLGQITLRAIDDRTVAGEFQSEVDQLAYQGYLRGTLVTNARLEGDWWNEYGQRGRFELSLQADGRSFRGTYGMGDEDPASKPGNVWTGLKLEGRLNQGVRDVTSE